jgi:hypothetical protein
VSSPDDPDTVTGNGRVSRPAATVPHLRARRDQWLRSESDDANTFPAPSQPGHGTTAVLRRQQARIVDGGFEGGYTGLFELICPSCGDHPDLNYSEVPRRLQWLRVPRPLEEALAVYHRHLGLPWPITPGRKLNGPG